MSTSSNNCENILFFTRHDPCCGYVEINFRHKNKRIRGRVRCPNVSHEFYCKQKILENYGFNQQQISKIL